MVWSSRASYLLMRPPMGLTTAPRMSRRMVAPPIAPRVVGAADGHGVDYLAALDGAIHGLGGEKLHQRYSTRGLGPSSARFSISRRTRPRSAADTNTRPCFSHSSMGG